MRWAALAVAVTALLACPRVSGAVALSRSSEMSFFAGFELGAGFDLEQDARCTTGGRVIYTAPGFLFGLHGGFRFNEIVGLSIGLDQSRHAALEEWGGAAGYTLGNLALRLAVPTPSRQTIVFSVGTAFGSFFFGSVNGVEDNSTPVVGGRGGILLEHEIGAAVVVSLGVDYLPLWRRAMGTLYLSNHDSSQEMNTVWIDRVDLGGSRIVHLLWVRVGLQFEWVIP
jgi:hypothetical protein